jgi:hypothetical protein
MGIIVLWVIQQNNVNQLDGDEDDGVCSPGL